MCFKIPLQMIQISDQWKTALPFFLFFYPQDVRRYFWHCQAVDCNPVVCFTVRYDTPSFTGLSEFSPEKCGSNEKGSWQNKYGWFAENGKYGGTEVMHSECSVQLLCSNFCVFCGTRAEIWMKLPRLYRIKKALSQRNSANQNVQRSITHYAVILSYWQVATKRRFLS